MLFTSTKSVAPPCDLRTALFRGLAPDGGLYMPSGYPTLGQDLLRRLRGADLKMVANAVAQRLFADALPPHTLRRIVGESLNFEIPLVAVHEGVFALELFHGPTLAFKDVGARFLAGLMAQFHQETDRILLVLTATSGDTGGAVANAFAGIPNTRVVVLFPVGQVSPMQRRQFTTLGGNIWAVAVNGTFDDCQRLAKEALSDALLRQSFSLTSANSINVGRLLPQVLYYFHGWSQLPEEATDIVMSVPSGNFGNLTAGLLAKRIGLDVRRFVAATNTNDVVPRYLHSGEYAPRRSTRTISSAMDVGDPSNFSRILALYSDREDELARDVFGSAHSDDETRSAIALVYQQYGYLLDPHSAVGYLGLMAARARSRGGVGVFLATAHPAKFAEIVEPLVGAVPLPERLTMLHGRPERTIQLEPTIDDLKTALLAG